jgi:hypothetical protein
MDLVVVLSAGDLGFGPFVNPQEAKQKIGTVPIRLKAPSLAPLNQCKSFSVAVPRLPNVPNGQQSVNICVAVPTMAQFTSHQDQVNAAFKALPENMKTYEVIQTLQTRIADLEKEVATLRTAKK